MLITPGPSTPWLSSLEIESRGIPSSYRVSSSMSTSIGLLRTAGLRRTLLTLPTCTPSTHTGVPVCTPRAVMKYVLTPSLCPLGCLIVNQTPSSAEQRAVSITIFFIRYSRKEQRDHSPGTFGCHAKHLHTPITPTNSFTASALLFKAACSSGVNLIWMICSIPL